MRRSSRLMMVGVLAMLATRGQAGPSLPDPQGLEAFCDGALGAQLAACHVPGAAVAIVEDGHVLLAKGYGYADLEHRVLVSAAGTIFRVGSVSKLFTWTAVMQLVEQGRLDLHADVNRYLGDIRVPDAWGRPVTMADLMSHSAGFEDRTVGIMARDAAHLPPLRAALARGLPARVRPPGQFCAYSNQGAALAGLIVEEVSGEPFSAYVQRHILDPLGMRHSTFQQPLPARLVGSLAQGYGPGDDPQAGGFEYIMGPPAGALSATAADMARFMIVHLQDGRLGPARILREQTARQMHRRLFSPHPGVNGWAYGFAEMTLNGQRALHHGGDTFLFHSELVLLPKLRMGIFVACNGAGGSLARDRFLQAFADRYYPAPPALLPRLRQDLVRCAGTYTPTRRAFTTWERVGSLFSQVRFSISDRSTLAAEAPGAGMLHWVQVAPLSFELADPRSSLFGGLRFRADRQGRITHCFLVNVPEFALERVPWYDTRLANLLFLLALLPLLLSAVAAWPVTGLLARRRRWPAPGWSRLARWAGWGAALLYLLAIAGLGVTLSNPGQIVYGRPPALGGLLAAGMIATALALVAAALLVPAWRGRWWSLPARVHYTLVALAALLLAGWLYHWHLLGFPLPW